MPRDAMRSLQQAFVDLDNSPHGPSFDLRLDLSEIIAKRIAVGEWTEHSLAIATGLTPLQISNLVHCTKNCTFETAGKILFALGIKGKLVEVPRS